MIDNFLQADLSVWQWIMVILAGILTGIINTLAGSGSLITLPIFIFLCGLPAPVANGTNRIGALFQSATGVYGFWKSGVANFSASQWLVVPAILGAMLGAWIATTLDKESMFQAIGFLMVFMLVVLIVNPRRWIRESDASSSQNKRPLSIFIFFVIGIYGGFIQAGVGIMLLAGLVLMARYNLITANSIKLLIVLLFNIPVLAIFLWYNQVDIGWGVVMAICQSIGAVIGVRFAARVPNANVWIHRLLIIIVCVSAIRFLGIYDRALAWYTGTY